MGYLVFWLVTVALCCDYGFTQVLRPRQMRFRGPRRFPLGPGPVRFPGAPFPGSFPPLNRQRNFVPQPPPPRRQILFSNPANQLAPNLPTSSPFLTGSVSGTNFGNVNTQSSNLVSDSGVTVDVGNLDFGTVAEAVMTDMFRENARGGNSFTNSNGVNANTQTLTQGQTNSLLSSASGGFQLDRVNVPQNSVPQINVPQNSVPQNNQIPNNLNTNPGSQEPIGVGLRPIELLNNDRSLVENNRVSINFGAAPTQTLTTGNLVGSTGPQTRQNATSSLTLSPAFPGFAPLQLPELGDDSWFSYLKGLLDRTNPDLRIFSNSTGEGMVPIPQRITDVPRGTMPIYIKNFRSNPAYVPFRLPGQPYNMLIPFNRDNREMVYPYLPIYIPYPNVGVDVPEAGQRFVAYLPFQPDRYKASSEGAGVVFPQLSSAGSFPVYTDRRPVVGNLMQRVSFEDSLVLNIR